MLYSQRLRDAGYRLGYVGKWHASYLRTPLDFGFHEVAGINGCDPALLQKLDSESRIACPAPRKRLKVTNERMMRWPGSEPFAMWGYREGPEEATPEYRNAELAIRMMTRFAKGTQPWHLEVHFVEPHDPYLPLKQYLDRYDPRSIPVPKSFADTFAGKPGLHRRESETWGAVTEDDVRQSRAHYYAYTEQLDAQIGRILEALDETGQADRTLVAFTADHGDMVGAHRMWLKGWIPYEECYRVPMIVRWPGKTQAGSKTARLVQTHDLAHTYVAAAGARAAAVCRWRGSAAALRQPAERRVARRDPVRLLRRRVPLHAANRHHGALQVRVQRLRLSTRCTIWSAIPDEMRNVVSEASYEKWTADMRARLYEMMARFHDPYGDSPEKYGSVVTGDRYCAARYLPRGRRA